MEKIKLVIGVPYTLEIGTNDASIGRCEGELCINMTGYKVAIPLKHVKDIEYTLTVPKKLVELSGKKLRYTLYVYAESARFMVEKGQLEVLSEQTFEVKKEQEDTVKAEDTKKQEKDVKSKETKSEEKPKVVKPKETPKPTEKKKETPKEKKAKVNESVQSLIKKEKLKEQKDIKRKSQIELEKLKEAQEKRKLEREAKKKEDEKKNKANQKILETLKEMK